MTDNNVEWGSQDKINKYKRETNEILDALNDIEEGWGMSLLTDESSFLDFDMSESEIELLKFKLQEEFKETDLIVDVAEKMNNFYNNQTL